MFEESAVEREVWNALRRRSNRLAVGVVVGLVLAFVALVQIINPLRAIYVVLGLYLFLALQVFELREELELRTDEPYESVREDLSSLSNPFTAIWLSGGSRVTETPSAIEFTQSGMFGLTEKTFTVSVSEPAPGTYQMRLREAGSTIAAIDVDVEPSQGETRLHQTGELARCSLLELIVSKLSGPEMRRHFGNWGYEILDGRDAIFPRWGFVDEPIPSR